MRTIMINWKKVLLTGCIFISAVSLAACGKKKDGDVTKYTDAFGNSIDAIYDENGKKIEEFTDEHGEQFALGYDNDGNLLSLIYDSDGNVTGYETLSGVNNNTYESNFNLEIMKKLEFGGQKLVDNDILTFTVDGIYQDEAIGYGVKVIINNKSGNNIIVSWDDVVMNGWMCDPSWIAEVAAGTQTESVVEIDASLLGSSDISKLTDISFALRVYKESDYKLTSVFKGQFNVYPYGEAAASKEMRTPKDDDKVVVDDANCSFVVVESENDPERGYKVKIYLNNKSGSDIICDIESASIDGKEADPYWSCFLNKGTQSYSELFWETEELSKAGINTSAVSEIKLKLKVYKYDSSVKTEDITYYIDGEYTVNP